MRKLAIALAGAAALTFASAAQATTYPINIDSSTNLNFVGLNDTNTGIQFIDNSGSGMFTDSVTFTNVLEGLYKLSVNTIGGADFFDDLSCAMCGITITGPLGTTSFSSGTSTATGFVYELDNFNFGAGQYTVTLTGNAPVGGQLSGLISFNAVPEPATWAMMLIGFGAMGASIRRRRTRVAARQFA